MAKWTPELKAKVQALRTKGWSHAGIALHLGLHPDAVRCEMDQEFADRRAMARLKWASISVHAADYDRLAREAARRGVPLCRLVHDLIAKGIPGSVPEAAE